MFYFISLLIGFRTFGTNLSICFAEAKGQDGVRDHAKHNSNDDQEARIATEVVWIIFHLRYYGRPINNNWMTSSSFFKFQKYYVIIKKKLILSGH